MRCRHRPPPSMAARRVWPHKAWALETAVGRPMGPCGWSGLAGAARAHEAFRLGRSRVGGHSSPQRWQLRAADDLAGPERWGPFGLRLPSELGLVRRLATPTAQGAPAGASARRAEPGGGTPADMTARVLRRSDTRANLRSSSTCQHAMGVQEKPRRKRDERNSLWRGQARAWSRQTYE